MPGGPPQPLASSSRSAIPITASTPTATGSRILHPSHTEPGTGTEHDGRTVQTCACRPDVIKDLPNR